MCYYTLYNVVDDFNLLKLYSMACCPKYNKYCFILFHRLSQICILYWCHDLVFKKYICRFSLN